MDLRLMRFKEETMDAKWLSVRWAILIVVALIVGIVSSVIWGPDNNIEQFAEKIIKQFSGMSVDISEE